MDFKKIEVNIPITGRQKTVRKNNQTLLARTRKIVDYRLQKALYCDLQDIYDMQIAYLKRSKLKVDKAVIKATISGAYSTGAIYYVARSDGTKVGAFGVKMEERSVTVGIRECTVPMLVFSNIITASSLQYVCEAVRDGINFILQQYAMVIGVNGVGVCALEMYTGSALSKLVFETCTGFGACVSGHVTTVFLMHKFYDADSIHSKYGVVEYAEISNVLERMQMIGEEVLS